MKRILLACLVLALYASAAMAGVTYDTVRATDQFILGNIGGTSRLLLDNSDSTLTLTLAPKSTTRYPISLTVAPSRAAGGSAFYLSATQTTNGLTSGSMQALDVVANAGSNANTGAIRGGQIKARQPDAGCTDLVALYLSADQKDQTCTNQRGLEVSIDGEAGGAATTTQGVVVFNNSSGNQGTDIAYDVNGGTASGHQAFTYDMRFQNGETVTNSTDGLLTWSNSAWDLDPVRSSSDYAYGVEIDADEDFFTGGDAQKSYLMWLGGDRPVTSAATGDSNDANLKVTYNNYAANDTNFIHRGVNVAISNRSGGVMGRLEAGNFGAQGKSGGTVSNIYGLTVTPENYGTVSDNFVGVDIVLKNEGAVATTEAGLLIRNLNNSIADAVGAAILVSDTGANTGFDYFLDFDGASAAVVADIRGGYGETISNTTDGQWSIGGTLTVPQITTATNATDTVAVATVQGYYGKQVFLTHADTVAVALNDPEAGTEPAGTWVEFMLNGDDSLAVTFAPETADTLVAPNNATADSVTFGSGHRMGAVVRFVSDGTKWHAINVNAGCTMTVTDGA